MNPMMKSAVQFLGLLFVACFVAGLLAAHACGQTLTPVTQDPDSIFPLVLVALAAAAGGAIYLRRKNRAKFDALREKAKDAVHTVGAEFEMTKLFVSEKLHEIQGHPDNPVGPAIAPTPTSAGMYLASLRAKLEADAKKVFPDGHEVIPGTHTVEQAMADAPPPDPFGPSLKA